MRVTLQINKTLRSLAQSNPGYPAPQETVTTVLSINGVNGYNATFNTLEDAQTLLNELSAVIDRWRLEAKK